MISVCQALLQWATGAEKDMLPMAMANTAARLLGGNTIHSTCRLPLKATSGRRVKLGPKPLQKLRDRWTDVRALVVDGISFLSLEILTVIERQAREAKRLPSTFVGGLHAMLAGDLLQLPPVSTGKNRTHSLSQMPPDDSCKPGSDGEDKKPQEPTAEHKAGAMIWKAFQVVVVLTGSMRTEPALAAILEEMRANALTSKSWSLLEARVLKKQSDVRLRRGPFAEKYVTHIVHRHTTRVYLNYKLACQEAAALRTPLFLLRAFDHLNADDLPAPVAEDIRAQVNAFTNSSKTKHVQTCLRLFKGMRILLPQKLAVAHGLMNGRACIVERNLFHEDEPELHIHGASTSIVNLKFVPHGILARALEANWELPRDALPPLPRGYDRRGLFVIYPKACYFTLKKHHDGLEAWKNEKSLGESLRLPLRFPNRASARPDRLRSAGRRL